MTTRRKQARRANRRVEKRRDATVRVVERDAIVSTIASDDGRGVSRRVVCLLQRLQPTQLLQFPKVFYRNVRRPLVCARAESHLASAPTLLDVSNARARWAFRRLFSRARAAPPLDVVFPPSPTLTRRARSRVRVRVRVFCAQSLEARAPCPRSSRARGWISFVTGTPASRRTNRASTKRIARPPSHRSRVVAARPRLSLRSCLSPKIVVAPPRSVTTPRRSSSAFRVIVGASSRRARRASFPPPSRARSLETSLEPRARSRARDQLCPSSSSSPPSTTRTITTARAASQSHSQPNGSWSPNVTATTHRTSLATSSTPSPDASRFFLPRTARRRRPLAPRPRPPVASSNHRRSDR